MNPIVIIYADLVKKGKKKYPDDIPESLRRDVRKYLEEHGYPVNNAN